VPGSSIEHGLHLTHMKSTPFLYLLLITTLCTALVARADDTDIYRSLYAIEEQGGKPQVMIIFDTSGSMGDYVGDTNGGSNKKITIAKRVITDLIEQNPQVDFGLAIFNYNFPTPHGGRVVVDLPGKGRIKSDEERSALVETIDGLGAYTSTPLCEAYYEIYRYFSGDKAWHGRDDRYQRQGGKGGLVDANPSYIGSAFDGDRYRSPLRPCEPIYVIYMTDGLPQNDTDANESIEDDVLTGKFSHLNCGYYSDADGGEKKNCMPELAYVMHQPETFTAPDEDGREAEKGPVTTYTIGFDTDQQLLVDTASPLNISGDDCPVARHDTRYNGGNACVGYFTASDAEQLQSAFQVAIDDILSRSTTFSAPAVSAAFTNNTQSFDRLYLPRFFPRNTPRWSGNVKRLRFVSQQSWEDEKGNEAFNTSTGDILDTAWTWWSDDLGLDEPDGNDVEAGGVGGLLRQSVNRALSNTAGDDGRTIYTDDNGRLVDFDADVGWASVPADWELSDDTSAEAIAQLIAWVRGRDVDDEDGDSERNEARPWILGDILHSDPIALNYGVESQDDEKLYIAFGTNAGFLHFIDGDSGQEQWAFTPQVLAPLHTVLRDNVAVTSADDTLQHPYGVDGPAAYVRVDTNGDGRIRAADGDRMLLAFGLRRGGRDYYGLDVSDPLAPTLAWEIAPTGLFSEMGQSWAAPVPTKVPGHDNPVFVISGGYDIGRDDPDRDASEVDAMGRAVYIVDAVDGSLVYRADPETAERFVDGGVFSHAIPAAPEVVDINSDGVADRIYLGDMGGHLWRLDLDSDMPENWRVREIASLGGSGISNRRFFNSIDFVSLDVGGQYQDLLLVGSGDRANPKSGGEGSDGVAVGDAFFAIRDPVTSAAINGGKVTQVTIDRLTDVTDRKMCDRGVSSDAENGCLPAWRQGAGWVLYPDGGYSLPLPGAKVLSESVTLDGIVYFSVYVPDEPESVCIPVVGRSYLFGLDLLTATGAVNVVDGKLEKGERAVGAGEYLLSRPSLVVRGNELFLQGIGAAALGQLVGEASRGENGGMALPYRVKRTYWYESTEEAQ